MADPAQDRVRGARRKSGAPLLGGAVALVAAGMTLLFVLWPRPMPHDGGSIARRSETGPPATPSVAPVASARPPIAVAPPASAATAGAEAGGASAPVPLDLFAGDAPEVIQQGHRVAQEGGMLRTTKLKEIYQFGKDHPGDARPHLILAGDSVNRGWYGFAVDHYVRAHKEEPRAAQDPRMLKDLVSIAGNERYGARGADALTAIYGRGALPAVNAAIVEARAAGDARRTDRLSQLASLLGAAP